MTTWSKTPPSEPGWYWVRAGVHCEPSIMRHDPLLDEGPWLFGPRIPSPEGIEAAKDALHKGAHACMMRGALAQADAMRAAAAKLEGRS